MQKVAIFSGFGIGDGLNLLILAYHFNRNGYKATLFHNTVIEAQSLFPEIEFKRIPEDINQLKEYDLIIVPKTKNSILNKIIDNRKNYKKLIVLYITYKKDVLNDYDYFFNKKISIARNLTNFCEKFFNEKIEKNENGLKMPISSIFQKNKKRIVLHPFSNCYKKNWDLHKYIKLYHKLVKSGFDPIFIVTKKEHKLLKGLNLKIKIIDNLIDLSNFIYESKFLIGNDSGPAHLASNLNINTIVISCSKKTMRLWRPDFKRGILIPCPAYVINAKYIRLKYKFWQKFISVKKIFKTFLKSIN